MSADYNEDRAYELGDPTRTRYLQEDEEETEEETMSPNVEFRETLRKRMYLDPPRRAPITEEWLVNQDARRREALRDTRWSEFKASCGALLVSVVLLSAAVSLLIAFFYAGKALWELLR